MTTTEANSAPAYKCINDIPGFPFAAFDELQAAVRARSFNVGIDPLAAARWSDRLGGGLRRTAVGALSVLLLAVGLAAAVAALALKNYWLLLAIPVQTATFYLSQAASPIRKWVTLAGALSIAAFLNLLLNQLVTAATLVAYGGLTFAAVRAAAFLASSGLRKALLNDEQLFLLAYRGGACSLFNTRTRREYRQE